MRPHPKRSRRTRVRKLTGKERAFFVAWDADERWAMRMRAQRLIESGCKGIDPTVPVSLHVQVVEYKP